MDMKGLPHVRNALPSMETLENVKQRCGLITLMNRDVLIFKDSSLLVMMELLVPRERRKVKKLVL
jgi:hypothetical protein